MNTSRAVRLMQPCWRSIFLHGGIHYVQADISAEEAPRKAQARFPRSDEDQGGPPHDQAPASQGPQQALEVARGHHGAHRADQGGNGRWIMAKVPTLRRREDLDRVFEAGHWRRLRPVAVGTYHRDDDQPCRFAFVAGRRIGNAVRRNRARRRLREALRGMLPEIREGADVVLAARDDTPEIDFLTLKQAIRGALASEGLLEAVESRGPSEGRSCDMAP